MEYDYNVLAARLTEVANICEGMEDLYQTIFGEIVDDEQLLEIPVDVLSYLRNNFLEVIDRLKKLTWFESSEQEEESSQVKYRAYPPVIQKT